MTTETFTEKPSRLIIMISERPKHALYVIEIVGDWWSAIHGDIASRHYVYGPKPERSVPAFTTFTFTQMKQFADLYCP